MLYQDKKGYEDYWRKHHVSPIARDIWMYTPGKEPQYRQLTTFGGEDREPVWAPDGKTFYYLSEENGSFNIYRRTPGDAKAVQLTHYTKNPVRYLSAATDGRLCYGFDGEIYTLLPGGEAQKVNISIVSDRNDKDIIRQIKSSGATEMAVSPDGKEVAFVLRGDVYVTSVEYKTTKQITNTPCQERTVDFAPDGRTLVYASERGGLWQLYTSTIVRKDEKLLLPIPSRFPCWRRCTGPIVSMRITVGVAAIGSLCRRQKRFLLCGTAWAAFFIARSRILCLPTTVPPQSIRR